MPRPTIPAVQFVEPISWAADFDALRRILRELSKQSRLETLQLLLAGPKQTSQLPCRLDELKAFEDLGLGPIE
ncbi:hypothetical protein [Flexivirga caeni]|uniref:hypothetical protein n=1 Tax=Flexivirga caeni TaxID=2294115 RepID=UPI0011CEB135|nr:hypothetical protein [Flexivirga caeni]